MFDRIAILAPGLLGASVARAARHYGAAKHLTLWARRPETRLQLKGQPWCDAVADTAADAVARRGVTGSSGAGTTSVTRTFEQIFRREGISAAVIEGDSFHRYDRKEMKQRQAEAEKKGNKHFSHFGPENNLFAELEQLFHSYAESGTGTKPNQAPGAGIKAIAASKGAVNNTMLQNALFGRINASHDELPARCSMISPRLPTTKVLKASAPCCAAASPLCLA